MDKLNASRVGTTNHSRTQAQSPEDLVCRKEGRVKVSSQALTPSPAAYIGWTSAIQTTIESTFIILDFDIADKNITVLLKMRSEMLDYMI